MWKYHYRDGYDRWTARSVRVDGNIESDHPTWLMTAVMGKRWRKDLASGPLATRATAERIAATLNRMEPERWDWFVERSLRELLDAGDAWG